eukprot:gnl/Spiro4/1128_TR591_c0_g1_i1.p1 gnl/Spiro4/1128_TR591_c0_g1~~gnl/Spiro4/1128_TR591_c0_g1_i1.p1  ORF type:complete len:195 (+),score=26.10 gnl/Spiro4/1128_TR591_c0_g1_i1:67-651(+)
MASLLWAVVVCGVGLFAGLTLHNKRMLLLQTPLPSVVWAALRKVVRPPVPPSIETASSPFWGERPHYFIPPSDHEQFSLRSRSSKGPAHQFIPYPNDPPHTFPAIKARALFTKRPRRVSNVFVDSPNASAASPADANMPAVSFPQKEERFRTVYTNAQREGLELLLGAPLGSETRGLAPVSAVYDFHSAPAYRF